MKQEDKLRNSLREYYDTQETSFSEEDWQQASAYLNTAKRKRKAWRFVIFLFIFSSTLLTVVFNFRSTNSAEKSVASVSEQRKKTSVVSRSVLVHTSTAAVQSMETRLTPEGVKHYPAMRLISIAKKQEPNSKSRADLSHMNSPVSENGPYDHEIPSAAPNETASEIDIDTGNSDVTPPLVTITLPQEPSLSGTITPEAVEKPTTQQETGQGQSTESFRDQNQVPVKGLPEHVTEMSVHTPSLILNDTNIVTLPPDTLKPAVQSDPVLSAGPDLNHSLSNQDTTASVNDTLNKLSGYENWVSEGLYFETGVAWFYGWKGIAGRDARGFSPHAGINYINPISHNTGFSFGLAYSNVPNLTNSNKVSRVSSYEYGERSKVTVITPSSVYYLVAPLRYHYYLNRFNSISGGINFAVLLNVYATVTTYDETPGFSKNYYTEKLGGYTEGFSWFDSQLALCYRRRIGNSLALQSEVFFGFTDVKQNDFFNLDFKERNSGAKLSLIYYLTGKKQAK